MELFGIIICKAVIAALALFIIALVVGAWYAFAKCDTEIIILKIIIFLGLTIISLLAVGFITMACIPLLTGSIAI